MKALAHSESDILRIDSNSLIISDEISCVGHSSDLCKTVPHSIVIYVWLARAFAMRSKGQRSRPKRLKNTNCVHVRPNVGVHIDTSVYRCLGFKVTVIMTISLLTLSYCTICPNYHRPKSFIRAVIVLRRASLVVSKKEST